MRFWRPYFNVVHKIQVYNGANFVPIAVFWHLFLKPWIKFKKLIFKKNCSHFSYVFCRYGFVNKFSLKFHIFIHEGYYVITTPRHYKASLGTSPIALNFSRKLPASLIYKFSCFMRGCKWWSRKSETFSVGIPEFEMTGCCGLSLKSSCTFGSGQSFLKL